ncbi:MAG: choice-of-anchor B family protein [Rhodanobacteraceae bacterium]
MGIIKYALIAAAFALTAHAHASPQHAAACIDGMAEGYPCNNVDLAGHLSLAELGANGGDGNDMWGWTDPDTGKEYALVGLENGTAFVDISDPENPLRLGNLPTHTVTSIWRDIKTYSHYAFIVSEASGHGMQIFDLDHLRDVTAPPVTFTEDAWYGQFGQAHNIVIDEQSGFAFAVGSRSGTQTCAAGLHMIDIHDPLNPVFAGCFSADGYTHDAQCIVYDGPDTRYTGHEVCFASNEDTLTIVDVQDKANPVMLSRTTYVGVGYTHQGWLTADRRHFLLDDELDEQHDGHNTRTYVWDVQDLTVPTVQFTYTGPVAAIDHNLYIRDGYAFESDYKSGLRILSLADIDNGSLSEAAYFDTFPAGDDANFDGAWSNYPYFASGIVAVSDISGGLFLLQPNLCIAPAAVDGLSAQAAGDNRIDLVWNASATPDASYAIDRTLGGCMANHSETIADGLTATGFSDTTASGQVTYGYRVRAVAASGQCSAPASACVEANTTGECTAPPQFEGITSAISSGAAICRIDLGWAPATPSCGDGANYTVYRSTDPAAEPGPDDLLTNGIDADSYADSGVSFGTDYTYIVRSVDDASGVSDDNSVRLTARAFGPAADGNWFSGAEVGDPELAGNATPLETPARTGDSPLHVAWEIVDDVSHSGERSYYSGYNNSECLALATDPIVLSSDMESDLGFWTRYGIELGWDAGVVQLSIDGGQNWQMLTPTGGYPSMLTHSGNACGLPSGTPVFTGSALDWTEYHIPLSDWAGQTIRLRWLFGTDTAQTDAGWWLDDLTVSHAQVPGQCVDAADAVFIDGFEVP